MERKINRKLEKVLVVEDHREFREFLELALTTYGWGVVLSKNGREALEKLRYIRPSLILMDMRMPEMDGFALARLLKNNPSCRDIPILAVTGLDALEDRKLCFEAGCDDHIAKPFTLSDPQDRMMRLLFSDDPGVESSLEQK